MKKSKPDTRLLIIISLLLLTGIIALATASVPWSLVNGKDPWYFLAHQILLGILPGIIMAFIVYRIPFNFIKKISPFLFIIAYILMFLVLVPSIGKSELGASRWLYIKSVSFQPSEFLKIATIIYLSALLSSPKQKNVFITFLIFIGLIFAALIVQSNLSTLIIISAISFIIFFCANTPLKYNLTFAGLGIIGFVFLALVSPYRRGRLMVFFHPETDPLGIGYQVRQTLISIGSGGFFGSGLGLSAQKYGFIPQSISDSIFAVFAEETGFIGGVALIALFIALTFTCFSLAKKENDPFLKLLVIGISSWFTVQAFVNIGAMTNLLPLSGTPLPFISYGGTHLIFELMACGLLLKISSRQPSC